ncbi:NfeD family protein [Kitasatospora atroaurantiaca]|uniref:Membrane protein implicated in regulation of membrane protease activity n=1 Tax=Kitasatospora atroaurantiaca TaxID=285545 RepID=A0A561EX56_9ACTN|nr:NfeD family protein [Kitasatospora atroaurantiaca]TWE20202.1 membrane protein implicated in regulation of membrane protease activity [Kitasatospora atroaurantiaca]
MDSWIWWLLAAVGLGIPLVLTAMPEFAMFAVGAGAAALAAGLGAGVVTQFLLFVGVSVALLVFVRPIAYRQLQKGPQVRMGIEALKGASAIVQEQVDGEGGRIKLNGEIWSARALNPGSVYEPGQQVDVVEIQGATALVV